MLSLKQIYFTHIAQILSWMRYAYSLIADKISVILVEMLYLSKSLSSTRW